MKTSCIRHPENEPLLILRKWQQEACNGNNCAAFLISIFEYWHNIKMEMAARNRELNDQLEERGKARRYDETLVQWHSEPQLQKMMLGEYGVKSIRAAIPVVVDLGFAEVVPNPDARDSKRLDHTRGFLFKPGAVNAWIAANRPGLASIPDPAKVPEGNGESAGTNGQNCRNDPAKVPEPIRNRRLQGETSGRDFRGEGGAITPAQGAFPPAPSNVVYSLDELETPDQLPEYIQPPEGIDPAIWVALLKICNIPLFDAPTPDQMKGLKESGMPLTRDPRITERHVYEFERRWFASYYGRDGIGPKPYQVRKFWGELMNARGDKRNGNEKPSARDGIEQLAKEQAARRGTNPSR